MTITINGTTGIAGVDGSAGTPAVQGTDTNTGIFFPAADTIAFGEGGAEVMRINSSGNVGIGTTSPARKFEVIADGAPAAQFVRTTTATNTVQTNPVVIARTSGNMADGFGTLVNHQIRDDAGVDNTIGYYGFVRSGADDSGAFYVATSNAGTAAERMRIDSSGNLLFNSGYGSVATAYGCRAWVNFNGAANTNLSGTYSRTSPSTTLTVTATAHGLIAGNSVNLDFTTGTGLDGIYTVVTVADANTFTITTVASTTTSGNVTLLRNTIRASGNVSSITDNGTGDYTVNFTTAMPDANYAIAGSVSSDSVAVSLFYINGSNTVLTTTTAKIVVVNISATAVDRSYIGLAFFR